MHPIPVPIDALTVNPTMNPTVNPHIGVKEIHPHRQKRKKCVGILVIYGNGQNIKMLTQHINMSHILVLQNIINFIWM